MRLLAALALLSLAWCASAAPLHATNVSAAYALLERVLPGSSKSFALSLSSGCAGVAAGKPCFTLSDGPGGVVSVDATSVSELTAGLGVYLREVAGLTLGWPRGGGSNVYTPAAWPPVGSAPIVRARIAKYAYMQNVCTHR